MTWAYAVSAVGFASLFIAGGLIAAMVTAPRGPADDWNVTPADRDARRDPKFLDLVRPDGSFADHPLDCVCRGCLLDAYEDEL